jgi:uncharacterized phage protein (TIGR02218 family)
MTFLPCDWLSTEAASIAFLWTMTRRDGVVLGFTSHDRTIRRDGIDFEARPGMTPSAVIIEDGFDVDTMTISGALTTDGVRSLDLELGRWDGAHVELAVCDWMHPDTRWMRLASGSIGEVLRQERNGEGIFSVELLSPMAALYNGGPPPCSALCRASLGDARCQVDMSGRWVDVSVETVDEDALGLAEPLAQPERFAEGSVRFLTGPLAGVDRPVGLVGDMRIDLLQAVAWNGPLACRVRLTEGCDRRFETCATRFGNAAQFDGEPHVPGIDALVRYGGS